MWELMERRLNLKSSNLGCSIGADCEHKVLPELDDKLLAAMLVIHPWTCGSLGPQ